MAAAGKKKKKKKPAPQNTEKRDNVLRMMRIIFGIVFGMLALYTLASLISYLFTWTSDQSLVFENRIFSNDVSAENSGGKLGFFWAHFLVSDLFGLGAFILPFLLGAISLACFRVKKVNLFRVVLVCIFGSIVISVLLAYIFSLVAGRDILTSGAGGSYGHYANAWLCSAVGSVGTGCIIVLALFLLATMCTPKVAYWFDDLIFDISHREKNNEEQEESAEESEEPEGLPLADDSTDESAGDDLSEDFFLNQDSDSDLEPGPESVPEAELQEEPALQPDPAPTPAPAPDGVELTVEDSENDFLKNMTDDEKDHLFDPRLDLPRYQFPPLSILNDYRDKWYEVSREELEMNKERIVKALDSYRIKVTGITAKMGPTVTLYKIHLADGVKISQVRSLEEDIAVSLGAKGVRVVTLLDSVGIEVANEKASVVALKAILNSPQFKEAEMELPMAMGITVTNEPFFIDLAKMPHLLVAGATGMGKSVGLNAMIASLLYTKHPSELKLVLVDPKKVELSLYSKLEKHFLAMLPDGDEAIITDTKKVVNTLKSLCIEMDARYDLLKAADVRQIKEYNKKFLNRRLNPNNGHKFLPYIVVIIDEFADLLMTAGREIEEPIARLAQKARAVGIHLVIATQRPTTNIITGTIKANFNSRIAFKVNSSVDSKTILDSPGAQRLIGRGDMLVIYPGADLTRVQCALIDTPEIIDLVRSVWDQNGYSHPFYLPEYVDESEEGAGVGEVDLHKRDQLFEECAKLVVQFQQGSTSMIQRKLGIGYARAGRIMDQLEAAGIVGPQEGSKARNVYVTDFDALDSLLESLNHI